MRRAGRWRGGTLHVLLLVVLGFACAQNASAHPQAPVHVPASPRGSHPAGAVPADGVSIQAVFDNSGDPIVVANFVPNGALATPSWEICSAGGVGACAPAPSTEGELQAGPEPPGTRFVATATYLGQAYSAAVTWQGTVQAVSPPTLVGPRRVGQIVTPEAGHWSGGWGDDVDQLGVEACRTPSGGECKMLGGGELGCPDDSSRTRLSDWFSGWYLFALDARLAADNACGGTGYSYNADLPVWPPRPTVSRSGLLGRVAGPPPPTVRILRRELGGGRRLTVASVDCRVRCPVEVAVFGRGVGVDDRLSLVGRRRVRIRRGPLRPGEVTITLHVDDGPAIVGRARISPQSSRSTRTADGAWHPGVG